MQWRTAFLAETITLLQHADDMFSVKKRQEWLEFPRGGEVGECKMEYVVPGGVLGILFRAGFDENLRKINAPKLAGKHEGRKLLGGFDLEQRWVSLHEMRDQLKASWGWVCQHRSMNHKVA